MDLGMRDAVSLRRYFDRILEKRIRPPDGPMLLAVARLLHLVAMWLVPDSASLLSRVSVGDLVHLLQLPPLFNLVLSLSIMWCLYLHPLLYWRREPLADRYLRLSYDLVIKRHLFRWYFLGARFRGHRVDGILAGVHRLCQYSVLLGLFLACYIMALVQLETYHRLWQMRPELVGGWRGWLAVLGLHLVLLLNFRAVLVAVNCTYLSFLLSLLCSVTNYIQFRQCEQLLRRRRWQQLQARPRRHVEHHLLWRFLIHHSRYMRLVSQVNGSYGRVLLAMLLTNGPASALLLVYGLVWHRDIDLKQWLVVLGISSTQALFVFGMHLIAIRYSYFVHGCSRLLLSLAARPAGPRRLSDRLKLHGYVERVHTNNRCGITYGAIALVTFPTFFKFILFYFKLIVISARILKQHGT